MVLFAPSTWNIGRRLYSSFSKKAQKYVLTQQFKGDPKKEDFKIVEEEIPDLKDGGKSLSYNITN